MDDTACIAVDWGGSNLRAIRLDRAGRSMDERATPQGIRTVAAGAFEPVLRELAGDWLRPDIPVVLSGMITSRQGWIETPYAPCPAGLPELAALAVRHRLDDGTELHFLPGVSQAAPFPDVIRGEEVQVLGAAEGDALLVLPGTHSKWVEVRGGRLARFATFLSGELYEVVRLHTLVGRGMAGDRHNEAAFLRGASEGLSAERGDGGFLRRLFGVRPLGLAGEIAAEDLASYLSGLIIGAEVQGGLAAFGADAERPVMLVGTTALAERYIRVLGLAGRMAVAGPQDAAARGIARLARALGVLP